MKDNRTATANLEAASWPERWLQLAVMINAGLSIEHALTTIGGGVTKRDGSFLRALGLVKRGASLASAFKTSGIISYYDYELLKSAEEAGKPGAGLEHIAQRRLSQIQRVKTLRTALLLPKAVLVIGGFAGVFIKIVSYGQSALAAICSVTLVIVLTLIVTYPFERILLAEARIWLSYLWPSSTLKRLSKYYQSSFELLFYRSLMWQLGSGTDAQTALKKCGMLLRAKGYRRQVANATNAAAHGVSMPASLNSNGLALSARMQQVLLIADQSGHYQNAIEHELNIQDQKFGQRLNDLFKWLPRIYYFIVLLIVFRFIMKG